MVNERGDIEMVGYKETMKDWRIKLYVVSLIFLGIIPLALMGLKFGMDFSGGTLIYMQLEKSVDQATMDTMVSVLQARLNGFGLKDISVRPIGDQYIMVSVSGVSNASMGTIKDVLSKQGKFEGVIDGNIALTGEDIIQVKTDPQSGYGWSPSLGQWRVPFDISGPGAARFAKVAEGKCKKVQGEVKCDQIWMFIDRPANATILIPSKLYEAEKYMYMVPGSTRSGYVTINDLEKNASVSIIETDNITSNLITKLKSENVSQVIVPENNTYNINLLNSSGINVVVKPKVGDYWLWGATGLKSVLNLTPGVTSGEPVPSAVIEGHAATLEDAKREMTKMVVILRSGKLPVKLKIATTMHVSPTLGQQFIGYAGWIGLLAWIIVGLIVYFRYRRIKLSAIIMANNLSEIIIILGIAALISWEIDMAALAGIVAAVGTGVDHMIVISDEILSGGKRKEEISLLGRIKKAFSIIFAAAATTTAAMLPLITLGFGLMKGFAITTLIGLGVGVLIVRPAFARLIEKFI